LDKWLEDTGYSTYNEEAEEAEKMVEEEVEVEEPEKIKVRKNDS
jgi:hypothetical protein